MAENQPAGPAAVEGTGHRGPAHDELLQAVSAHASTVHGSQPLPGGTDASQQPSWKQYSSVFTASKAGMQNVDKEKVKRIVYEMSKDSAHFKNEQRKQAQVDARIAQLKERAASISHAELAAHQKAADAQLAQLEAGRDLSRTWLHADMDAFYASVEELDRPDLKSKPMAVGGMGMITTANYEARKFGVRSAMPGFIARKLCPQLAFVKPNFRKYEAAAAATREVFKVYDPHFEAGSLDEAYLDVTDYCAAQGMTGEQVAAQLRAGVEAATRLTCSVGIAPNATLAKVASDLNKPNGQALVVSSREAVMAFVHDLPIRKVPGIGKVSEQTLNALGITTCGQLLQQRGLIAALFSSISARFFLGAGLGLGHTQHGSGKADEGGAGGGSSVARKGISCERTFANMSSPADMEKMAENLVQHLAEDMESEAIEAKTLTLKLKTTDFAVRTRAVTLPGHVHTVQQMLPPILKLLRAELPCEIRLMGVRGSSLRRVASTEDMLNAAAAHGRLNALQRMILQGRQQQQQRGEAVGQQQGEQQDEQHLQQEQEQEDAGGEVGQSAAYNAEHGAASALVSYDLLDDEEEAGDASCSYDGFGTDDESTLAAWGAAAAPQRAGVLIVEASDAGAVPGASAAAAAGTGPSSWVAGGSVAVEQLDRQQALPQQQHQWQQWQQHCGHGDQLVAQLNALHKQQQQQQHQDVQGSASAKRPRVVYTEQDSCHEAQQQAPPKQLLAMHVPSQQHHQQQHQQQQAGPTQAAAGHQVPNQPTALQAHEQPAGQPLLSGEWYRASQLLGCGQEWQQQQHVQHIQVQRAQGWQQQQQQQQPHHQQCSSAPRHAMLGQQQLPSSHPSAPDQEAGRHASAAAAGAAVARSTQQHGIAGSCSSSKVGIGSSTWACLACTFSGNKQVLLRCDVCGTPKGSSTPPAPDWLSGAAASAPAATAAQSKSGDGQQASRRRRGRGSGHGSSNSSKANAKQLTLDQVVQPPR